MYISVILTLVCFCTLLSLIYYVNHMNIEEINNTLNCLDLDKYAYNPDKSAKLHFLLNEYNDLISTNIDKIKSSEKSIVRKHVEMSGKRLIKSFEVQTDIQSIMNDVIEEYSYVKSIINLL